MNRFQGHGHPICPFCISWKKLNCWIKPQVLLCSRSPLATCSKNFIKDHFINKINPLVYQLISIGHQRANPKVFFPEMTFFDSVRKRTVIFRVALFSLMVNFANFPSKWAFSYKNRQFSTKNVHFYDQYARCNKMLIFIIIHNFDDERRILNWSIFTAKEHKRRP